MNRALYRATMEVTGHLLVAGGVLVLSSLWGLGAGPLVLGFSVALVAGLFLARDSLATAGTVGRFDLGSFLRTAWIAPALAATTTVLAWGATRGELQSLGGLLGLAGMLNYFCRPIYLGLYETAVSVTGKASTDRR